MPTSHATFFSVVVSMPSLRTPSASLHLQMRHAWELFMLIVLAWIAIGEPLRIVFVPLAAGELYAADWVLSAVVPKVHESSRLCRFGPGLRPGEGISA